MNSNTFYHKLEQSLPESTGEERKKWANEIIDLDLDIKTLSNLLFSDKRIAMRFSWLLSGIGHINPDKLLGELPFLFELSDRVKSINFKVSFATYWLICGIPLENEAVAIDHLLDWIQSPQINVTTKSRAVFALFNLSKKYPDLKNELKFCLEDQMDNHSEDFRKRAQKILLKLA